MKLWLKNHWGCALKTLLVAPTKRLFLPRSIERCMTLSWKHLARWILSTGHQKWLNFDWNLIAKVKTIENISRNGPYQELHAPRPPVVWCGGRLSCKSWSYDCRVIEDVNSKHCFSPRRNACSCFDRLKEAWRLAESIFQNEFWAPGMKSDWILIEISLRRWKQLKI